jgi:mycothiol synthase
METNLKQNKAIELPAGYVLRPVQMEDLTPTVELINRIAQKYSGGNELDEAELRNFWEMPELQRDDDVCVVTAPNGQIVGYAEMTMLDKQPVHPFLWIRIDPEHMHLGKPMMEWLDARSQKALELCPEELRVSVQCFNPKGAEPIKELLEAYGYQVIRHSFQMRIELDQEPPAAEWPQGIELRPFEAERDLRAVYEAYSEAFSDHYGYVKRPLEIALQRFKHGLMGEGHDPKYWFVAWDGDKVAGISLCFKESSEDPEMSWLELLAVPREWRKRGLGKALLLHTFGEFYKAGKKAVGLSVDASNLTGALRLYESAGMKVSRQYDRFEKELRPGKELMTVELSE